MGRLANDGRGRMGGRAKGTKNLPPKFDIKVDQIVSRLLDNRGRAITQDDWAFIDQYQRVISAAVIAKSIDRLIQDNASNRPERA